MTLHINERNVQEFNIEHIDFKKQQTAFVKDFVFSFFFKENKFDISFEWIVKSYFSASRNKKNFKMSSAEIFTSHA